MKFSFNKKDDDSFEVVNSEENISEKKVSHTALTPDEVLSGFSDNSKKNVKNSGALDMLKKRIQSAMDEDIPKEDIKKADETKSKPEIKVETKPSTEKTVSGNAFKEITTKASKPEKPQKSLFDKCLPYITDDDGNEADINSEPLYKLQTVAEILQLDSEKRLARLSKNYEVSFDDLGHSKPQIEVKEKPETAKTPETKPEVSSNETIEETQIFDEQIPLKQIQSNVKSIISDIDGTSNIVKSEENIADTATITFTVVNDDKSKAPKISTITQTRSIDLTGELAKLPESNDSKEEELQLEKNEFENFSANEEISPENALKFIRKFSIKKRNAFITSAFSIFIVILLSIMKLPFMTQLILSFTQPTMIICAAMSGLVILLNYDMFASFKNIFKPRSSPDVCASLASLSIILYAVFGILAQSIIIDLLLLLCVILSFRALFTFFKASYTLNDIKLLNSQTAKHAVRLINDPAVTFAMAKNAIEGDVLIAAPQKVSNITDYMKYSQFSAFFGGKLPILNIISIVLSIIFGFACANYFDGLVYGFYAAAAVQCFAALPVLFFIETLPLYRASKKLRKKGGVIAGKTAAEHLEAANAVVLNSADIFPTGTITLHQMKVLSENNLEDTLIRAASLTESLNSSLAPVFKKIINTGNIEVLPDTDTIKYEDRMGISGWVDNRLLFIGNRTLMEAHGIDVPSVEVDRKILRQGFFPVYVATEDKACALLIVKYSVDREIAKELRTLTASGVTILVNSCDPNLIEEMICDYFGLYTDSVKVMTAAGSYMYKNALIPAKTASAPAMFKLNPLAIITALNCAAKIKRSNLLLNVLYVLSLVFGVLLFAYSSLSGTGELISEGVVLLYGLASTLISYLAYLFTRP